VPDVRPPRRGHTGKDPTVMRDHPVVTDLVTRAQHGDKQAWDTLVEHYAPLVWSICHSHRLSRADVGDVGQTVWLNLVAQLDSLRDPAALASWLTTTTRRECGKICRAPRPPQTASWQPGTGNIPGTGAEPARHQLLTAEHHTALRQAFTALPPS